MTKLNCRVGVREAGVTKLNSRVDRPRRNFGPANAVIKLFIPGMTSLVSPPPPTPLKPGADS